MKRVKNTTGTGKRQKKKTYLSLFNKTKTVRDDVYDVDGDNDDDVTREDDFEEEDGNGAEEGDDEKKRSIEEKIVVC